MRELKFRTCKINGFGFFDLLEDNDFDFYRFYISAGDNIEQYTGLKDKNGKEIYEGDIVKLLDAPVVRGKALIVKFGEFRIGEYNCNKMTGWMIQVINGEWVSSLADENANCEVIGNIHENPELLEGGEE